MVVVGSSSTLLAPAGGCSRAMQRSSISSMDSTVVTSDAAEEPLYSRIDHSSSTESQPAAVHHHHHHHHDGMSVSMTSSTSLFTTDSFVMQIRADSTLFHSTRIDSIWPVSIDAIHRIFIAKSICYISRYLHKSVRLFINILHFDFSYPFHVVNRNFHDWIDLNRLKWIAFDSISSAFRFNYHKMPIVAIVIVAYVQLSFRRWLWNH